MRSKCGLEQDTGEQDRLKKEWLEGNTTLFLSHICKRRCCLQKGFLEIKLWIKMHGNWKIGKRCLYETVRCCLRECHGTCLSNPILITSTTTQKIQHSSPSSKKDRSHQKTNKQFSPEEPRQGRAERETLHNRQTELPHCFSSHFYPSASFSDHQICQISCTKHKL